LDCFAWHPADMLPTITTEATASREGNRRIKRDEVFIMFFF
jgi:hypothetical protein